MNTPLTQSEVDERALFLADFRQREGIPAGVPDEMVWASTRAATQFIGWQAGRAAIAQNTRQAAPEAPASEQHGHWEPMGKFAERFVPEAAAPKAAFENPMHKDCYCGGWTDDTGDFHNQGCPEIDAPAATTASEIASLDEKTSGGIDE